MELFREKNGKYYADSLSQAGGKTSLRLVILFVGIAGFAGFMFLSPVQKEIPDRTPLMIGMGIVILSNLIALLLKRAGHGSGIIVDQYSGTLSYRKPGGNRHNVQVSSLRKIIISVIPDKASILSLEKSDGGRHVVMYSSDTMKMRQLADELSSLIALTVGEEMREYQHRNAQNRSF